MNPGIPALSQFSPLLCCLGGQFSCYFGGISSHPGRMSKAITGQALSSSRTTSQPPLPHSPRLTSSPDSHSPSQHDCSIGWPGPPPSRITQHLSRQVLEGPAITPTLPGARRLGKGIIKEEVDRPFFTTKNISFLLEALAPRV